MAEVADNLAKSKEEYENLRKQIEIELPKKRKQAILIEQIRCEEQIIDNANLRLTRLKQELEGEEKESTNKVHKILGKVQKFVAADKTKELIIILLLLEAALFIFSILLGNLIAQILAVAGTAFVLYYAKNNYDFFKTEKGEKIISLAINLTVSMCYFDALFNGNIKGFIWWLILSMIPRFISKSSNMLIDRIVPFICIPLFFCAFVISDYETIFIMSIALIHIFLLIANIIRIVKIIKSDTD